MQDCVSSCEDVYVKHGTWSSSSDVSKTGTLCLCELWMGLVAVGTGALGPLIVEKENSGAAVPQGSTKDDAASGAEGGKLRCRNYGCNQHFDEEGNHDTACKCVAPICLSWLMVGQL